MGLMFKAFFSGLTRNFLDVFRGRNLWWHALMIGLTYVLVVSGVDWKYFEATREAFLQSISLPAAIIGFFAPIIIPVGMYIAAEIRKDTRLMQAAVAAGQAVILGSVVSSLYKAFTGRMQPEFYTHLSNVDISHVFQFGFLRHGIFWGWPSSHTTIAFAMSAVLIYIYRKNRFIVLAAGLYAVSIGLGVSVSIHWLSDFVAGAILGTLIGTVVGARALGNR